MNYHPVTPDRWEDFEKLFGASGAYGGCWCMWWRVSRKEFEENGNPGNKLAMKKRIGGGQIPGILAYDKGEPVGWCSVAPRKEYPPLNRSPVLKPIDDTPVWSIVCFFVVKEYRGQGTMVALIQAAVAYAKSQRAKVVEAYPTQPRKGKLPPVSSFMGIPAAFEKAGFVEVKRPSKARVVMRYYFEGNPK